MNYGLKSNANLLIIFGNKVLLEHSHVHVFLFIGYD